MIMMFNVQFSATPYQKSLGGFREDDQQSTSSKVSCQAAQQKKGWWNRKI
jgi:hypothetical protein